MRELRKNGKYLVGLSLAFCLVGWVAVRKGEAFEGPRRADPLLQFTSQGQALGFRDDGYFVSNGKYALRVGFVGANAVAPQSDGSATPSAGGGMSKAAPPLSRVTYPDLWDGVSVTYDRSGGGIVTSTYRLDPHADPRAIRLAYNGPVKVNADGTLSVTYGTVRMTETAPVAWQEIDGQRVRVPISFRLVSAIRNRLQPGFLRLLPSPLH